MATLCRMMQRAKVIGAARRDIRTIGQEQFYSFYVPAVRGPVQRTRLSIILYLGLAAVLKQQAAYCWCSCWIVGGIGQRRGTVFVTALTSAPSSISLRATASFCPNAAAWSAVVGVAYMAPLSEG